MNHNQSSTMNKLELILYLIIPKPLVNLSSVKEFIGDLLLTEYGFLGIPEEIEVGALEDLPLIANYCLSFLYKVSPDTPLLSIHAEGVRVTDIEASEDGLELSIGLEVVFKEDFACELSKYTLR